MKVLIADDHSVVRQGVSLILREAFTGMEVVHTDSFSNAVIILKDNFFDLLLLDINLQGGNRIAMVDEVRSVQKDIKILIFSAYDEEQYALRYIKAGAQGYLNKLSSEDKIIEAVKIILDGGNYIGDKIRVRISENSLNKNSGNPLDALSGRELEIAGLLAKGDGNLEIANKLDIGTSTVSTYKSRIFEKLGVSNVVSLVEKFKLYTGN
ncbi:response regulator [Flavobacterium cerinum]|uniref:Response regulator transcription factor n=1 Tax=Flavobacterium cerinum TaxID=2502784 RepID=A0A444HG53_9FLAO|nr:response regulator transcription factor [Flavobacterium cerinum]RWX03889.1 response regulator transcription factor [Flavobacterium cerinum]